MVAIRRKPKFKAGDCVKFTDVGDPNALLVVSRVLRVDPYYKRHRYKILGDNSLEPVESILELVPGPW